MTLASGRQVRLSELSFFIEKSLRQPGITQGVLDKMFPSPHVKKLDLSCVRDSSLGHKLLVGYSLAGLNWANRRHPNAGVIRSGQELRHVEVR